MLALTRKKDEAIIIGGDIEIRILGIQGDKVKIGISAPREYSVYREEIYSAVKDINQEASKVIEVDMKDLKFFFKNDKSL